jgi:hypothetical protein
MAAKFGVHGKICSTTFVTSTTDVLEPCAALPSLTKFATEFHLPASLNAFRLSPSTLITIADFFDGQAMSPECHKPELQERKLTSWVDNYRPLGCQQMNWSRTLKNAL